MIWAIEAFIDGSWRFRDWELTRDAARCEMECRQVLNDGVKFRIRKYVRAEK